MFHSTGGDTKPYTVSLKVCGVDMIMEVDAGAALSVISEQTYNSLWSDPPPVQPCSSILKTYTGEVIKVKGVIDVDVMYKDQQASLKLIVTSGEGPCLLGRDWLNTLKLDWSQLNQVYQLSTQCQDLVAKHRLLFADELGLVQGMKAKFHINKDATPKFCKARPVPYALKSKVEDELSRLEKEGVIRPVEFSQWAAPIVPIVKRDGTIRICGDYKLTVNRAAKTDAYPLPRIEDLFASLTGGQLFTKLDLAHAYQQVPLEEESQLLTTVNTHKGLYCYNRLPFGVASAPAIFQRAIETVLQGIPHVCVYLDDILISGTNTEDHLKTLETVLSKLETAGIRLKRSKCSFMLPSLEYLGHKISSKGLQPTSEKVQAIHEAPAPKDVSQLKSFLRLLNYYCKFLPHLSTILAPLYKLLQKKSKWQWESEQQKAFDKAKQSLTSDCLLVHYDPDKELVLACDASPYGIGAVLSHKMEDGQDKPIAFTSRTLATAERHYSQLDKESLTIIFGVKKFHQYLCSRHFTILSDHKPLQYLFKESSPMPAMASARIQRWALSLAAYDYKIVYKPGSTHANTDMLSRLPLPQTPSEIRIPGETILLMDMLQSTPVSAQQIKHWTDCDPIMSAVRSFVLKGWPDKMTDPKPEEIKPYVNRKPELSIHDGCLMWGNRVVVPPPGRTKLLEQLHDCHPGMSRMKNLARSYVWWPSIDQNIEDTVKTCVPCQRARHLPPPAPLQPWEWPGRPWARLHLDYAGPLLGHMFLILVDAHSKWMEVKAVKTATSTITIEHLRNMFATHGLPEMLVTDNASYFTSQEFQDFAKLNGIRHVTSAPYHPASNGLAERAVQTVKEFLKKPSSDSLQIKLSRFLLQYQITPHSTTGTTPAELLLGRRPRTQLDLALPDISTKVHKRQQVQKENHDRRSKNRQFTIDDLVYVRKFPSNDDWISGNILKANGPLSFMVELESGQTVSRHIDHIRHRIAISRPEKISDWTDLPDIALTPQAESNTEPSRPQLPVLRRSARISVPPQRYSPGDFHS